MKKEHRILIVDDNAEICQLLQVMLEGRGYITASAQNGGQAIELARGWNPDLIIMDVMMPGIDGVDACREIRKLTMAPVLFLTAKTQLSDKQEAYDVGGDDYLSKPFLQPELLMKVDALIRRYTIYSTAEDPALPQMNEAARTVLKNGQTVELTDKEWEILSLLMKNRGKTFDVSQIYETIWGERFLQASSNTVMVHILNLRKKLEDDPANPALIRTVWGKGYRID